jgi:hypothetical protein
MIKLLTVLIVLAFNVQNSQKCYIKISHISDLVVQETGIAITAAKVPSPTIIDREQDKKKIFHFTAPKLEVPIGRIDQWEYCRI